MVSQAERPWSAGVRSILAQRTRYREAWEEAGLCSDKTPFDRIAEGVAKSPGPRLIYWSETGPSETTLKEALADSEVLAAAFVARGLRADDVIIVQAPHWRDGLLAWLAALRLGLGLVVVRLVHILGAAELGSVLRQTGAKALLTLALAEGAIAPVAPTGHRRTMSASSSIYRAQPRCPKALCISITRWGRSFWSSIIGGKMIRRGRASPECRRDTSPASSS
jgi:non-ribosomal peptide synthetase component E (peptide arylation enzyme)